MDTINRFLFFGGFIFLIPGVLWFLWAGAGWLKRKLSKRESPHETLRKQIAMVADAGKLTAGDVQVLLGWKGKVESAHSEETLKNRLDEISQILQKVRDEVIKEFNHVNQVEASVKLFSDRMTQWAKNMDARVNEKAEKLSDDDQFAADAKLSNQITTIAKHTATKTVEESLNKRVAELVKLELQKLHDLVLKKDGLGMTDKQCIELKGSMTEDQIKDLNKSLKKMDKEFAKIGLEPVKAKLPRRHSKK